MPLAELSASQNEDFKENGKLQPTTSFDDPSNQSDVSHYKFEFLQAVAGSFDPFTYEYVDSGQTN